MTFLEEYDFSDKTIVSFCSHGGSGPQEKSSVTVYTITLHLYKTKKLGNGLPAFFRGGFFLFLLIAFFLAKNTAAVFLHIKA